MIVSTLVSVVVGLALLLGRAAPQSARAPGRPELARLAFHPLAQLLLVCVVLYMNQVLFSTFSIIELALPNPYTRDDLALRYSVCAGEELREAVVQSGRAMADRSTASATSLVRVHPARASSRLT